MKISRYFIIFMVLPVFAVVGCAELNTDLAIPQKKLPPRFKDAEPSAESIADVKWRQFFKDKQLLDLIDIAIGNNQDLQIALQRIEVSRASVKLANAALLPEVKLNISSGIRKFGLYTMDGAGNASTFIRPGQIVPENLPDYYVGLQTAWEIDVWGKLRSLRQSALAGYLASIEGTNFVISNLVGDVAVMYYELLTLDHQLEIIKKTAVKQNEALEVVKWQKVAGRANELAVQQFNAQLLNTQALEKSVEQKIVATENRINFLLGRYPQAVKRDKDTFFAEMPAAIETGFPSKMLANRPDVRAAEQEIKASEFDLKAAKAAFYPNFNITASIGYQAFNPEFLFMTPSSLAYSAMGSLIAPIINRKSLKAKFNTAKANQLTAMYQYQKTILNAFVEVANELNNIQQLQQIAALKKQQSEKMYNAVEAANDLYRYAKATYLEVLNAQQNALQSKLELIETTKQQQIARINLYRTLGGGWK